MDSAKQPTAEEVAFEIRFWQQYLSDRRLKSYLKVMFPGMTKETLAAAIALLRS